MLRTKQSIPEPPNKIVPAFMTLWRWSRLVFITTTQIYGIMAQKPQSDKSSF
jgi:hypothetical protein